MTLWKRMLGLKAPEREWFSSETAAAAARVADAAIEITYLGTAGFILKGRDRTLVLDPYLSRPGLRQSLSGPLRPDTGLIRRTIPQADDVLIGHAHYDHILDAPDLCKQTGARLIGSRAAVMVGRAAGLPEAQLVETAGRESIQSGAWTVRGLPSRHGRVFGRVPIPGDIESPPPWPPRLRDLRHGLVLNWLVDTGGLRIVHIDSADFINAELQGLKADVVCLCAIGRQYRANYVQEVVSLLQPKWIIPCHWDTMLTPLHAEPDLIPGVDLPGFLDEIRAAGCEPLLLPILGRQQLPCRHAGPCASDREPAVSP